MIYTKLRLIGAHPVEDDDPDGDWRILVEEMPVFFLRPFIVSRIRSYIGDGHKFHDENTDKQATCIGYLRNAWWDALYRDAWQRSRNGYLAERVEKAKQLAEAKDKFKRKPTQAV